MPDTGYQIPDTGYRIPDTRYLIIDIDFLMGNEGLDLSGNIKLRKNMERPKSFRDLEIFQLAKKLAVEIHQMTLSLPKFELYEEGSQIRRSSKSTVAHIVEGFGRRAYKADFLRYIGIALTECDETQVHLELLFQTGSLKDKNQFEYFSKEYHKLSKKLNRFHSSVMKYHISKK